MKRLSIFMNTFILFYATGCIHTLSPMKVSLIQQETSSVAKPGTGGNPEVINDCLGLTHQQKKLCLDYFFPDNINLMIHSSGNKPIMLAGRGKSIERRKLKLHKNDDKILLYLDTSYVKSPLTCNIKNAKLTSKKETLVVEIAVQDIDKKIILTNREGVTVLDYTIMK